MSVCPDRNEQETSKIQQLPFHHWCSDIHFIPMEKCKAFQIFLNVGLLMPDSSGLGKEGC